MVLAINQGVKICKHITKTRQFEPSSKKRINSIRPQNLDCTSKNVVYLFNCKTCHKQYTGSAEECSDVCTRTF